MTASRSQPPDLEEILDRFETAWADGDRPVIDDYLPDDPEDREQVLIELIHADLESRLKGGEPARVEEYLARYPELRGTNHAVGLVLREMELRRRREPDLHSAEYWERFPELAGALAKAVTVHVPVGPSTDTPAPVPGQPLSLPQPASLHGYEILGELGRGGMGVVYKARHCQLNRIVALKMIISGLGEGHLQRFFAEARVVARLSHPNIVQIYDVGAHDGSPFLSLEFVEGGSLDRALGGVPQTSRDAARLVETLARATHYAHEQGVIHRDLKPANVLLDLDGNPRISDFGLAKQLDSKSLQTQTGEILGTPSYMAPEQTTGSADRVGPLVDVYALGAILYECLTGRPPFRAANVLDTLEMVRSREPMVPRVLQPRVPRDLETICLKCLEKVPERRYRSAQELADDLRRFLDGAPVQARPVGRAERLLRWCRRNPALASAIVLGVVALVSLVAFGIGAMFAVEQASAAHRLEEEKARAESAQHLAEEQRGLAEEYRSRAEHAYHLARLAQGTALCEQGDIAQGTLRLAELPEDPELQRLYRTNLAGWSTRLHELTFTQTKTDGTKPLVFQPDGRLLVTTEAGAVRTWDVASGRPAGAAIEQKPAVHVAVFLPDGKTLVTAGASTTVRFWDTATGRLVGDPLEHEAIVKEVAVSPDSLATITDDKTVRLWDTATHKQRGEPIPHQEVVTSCAFSPDGKRLATAEYGGKVRLWDAMTAKSLGAQLDHPDVPRIAGFGPNSTLVTGCEDGQIRVWDTTAGKVAGEPMDTGSPVYGIALGPDARTVVTRGRENYAQLWDVETRKPLGRLEHELPIESFAFHPERKLIATGGEDHKVRLWDIATRGVVGQVMPHPDRVPSVAFSRDGQLLLAWGTRLTAPGNQRISTARVWRIAWPDPGEETAMPPDGQPAGDWTVTASEGAIRLRNVKTIEQRLLLGPVDLPEVKAVAFSGDSKRVLVVSRYGLALPEQKLGLWDTGTGQPLWPPRLDPNGALAAAIRPDGSQFLTGHADRTAQVWEAETGKAIGSPLRHDSPVQAVAYSADGRTAATGDRNGSVRLWDSATARSLGPGLRHPGEVRSLAFSADGKHLAVGGGARHRRWRMPVPISGSPDEIRRRLERMSGLELDASGVVRPLADSAWEGRRSPR